MKKAIIIIYYTLIIAMVGFLGMSFRWMRYNKTPVLRVDKKEIVVSINEVHNPLPNYEYYYTLETTYKMQADKFPFVKTLVLDTIRRPVQGFFDYREIK